MYYVQKTGLHTVQMALKQMIEAVNVQSEESGTTQLVAENIKAAKYYAVHDSDVSCISIHPEILHSGYYAGCSKGLILHNIFSK